MSGSLTHASLGAFPKCGHACFQLYVVCAPLAPPQQRILYRIISLLLRTGGPSWASLRLIKDSPKNYKHVELEGRHLLGFKAGYQVGGKRWALVINILAGGQCLVECHKDQCLGRCCSYFSSTT